MSKLFIITIIYHCHLMFCFYLLHCSHFIFLISLSIGPVFPIVMIISVFITYLHLSLLYFNYLIRLNLLAIIVIFLTILFRYLNYH